MTSWCWRLWLPGLFLFRPNRAFSCFLDLDSFLCRCPRLMCCIRSVFHPNKPVSGKHLGDLNHFQVVYQTILLRFGYKQVLFCVMLVGVKVPDIQVVLFKAKFQHWPETPDRFWDRKCDLKKFLYCFYFCFCVKKICIIKVRPCKNRRIK